MPHPDDIAFGEIRRVTSGHCLDTDGDQLLSKKPVLLPCHSRGGHQVSQPFCRLLNLEFDAMSNVLYCNGIVSCDLSTFGLKTATSISVSHET